MEREKTPPANGNYVTHYMGLTSQSNESWVLRGAEIVKEENDGRLAILESSLSGYPARTKVKPEEILSHDEVVDAFKSEGHEDTPLGEPYRVVNHPVVMALRKVVEARYE